VDLPDQRPGRRGGRTGDAAANRVHLLTVPDADRAELEWRARVEGGTGPGGGSARIVLLAAGGLTGAQIADRAGCTEPTVVKALRCDSVRAINTCGVKS